MYKISDIRVLFHIKNNGSSTNLKELFHLIELNKRIRFAYFYTSEGVYKFILPSPDRGTLNYTPFGLIIPGIEKLCVLGFHGKFEDIELRSTDLEEVMGWNEAIEIKGFPVPESELRSLNNRLKPIDSAFFRF
jgi:hypothetical protein